jgi:hypothetical protein
VGKVVAQLRAALEPEEESTDSLEGKQIITKPLRSAISSYSKSGYDVAQNSGETVAGRVENLKPWPKGVSGNPAGRPKNDISVEIARAVFENNPEAIYTGCGGGSQRVMPGSSRY